LQSDYIGFSDLNNSPVNLSFLTREPWQSDDARLKNRQILKVIMSNELRQITIKKQNKQDFASSFFSGTK
jgi:hypothetical protein